MAKTVILDPGHGQYGNPYPAASGFYEGTQMWKLGQFLGARLEECGIKVINTRPVISMDPDLTVRGSTAGKNKADMFISLHSDAIGSYASDSARGVSAYYSIQDAARNKQFASKLSAAVSTLIGTRDRGALTRIGSGNLDYYGVIRSSAASGCKCAFLVEHGFHTSPSDVKYLISDEWLKKIAEVECAVICEFLSVSNTSTGTTPVNVTPTITNPVIPVDTYKLNNTVSVYVNAADARNNRNSTTSYPAGEYYVYKEYEGMINISKTPGKAGGWINPADNMKVADEKTIDTVMDDDISMVQYSNNVVRASLDKSANKTIKNSTVLTYGQLAVPKDPKLTTVKINTALVEGLEILKDYLNISSIEVVLGNAVDADVVKSQSKCICPAKHVSGFAVDIICRDSRGEIIPSKIICAVANKIGFNGIGRINEDVTHLDIRQDSARLRFDALERNKTDLNDIDDFYCVTQADINAYVTGIQKIEDSVKIDDSDDNILGTQKVTGVQLNKWIYNYNTNVDPAIAEAFIKIGEIYGIRGDIAFCQSCVETGYFKYAGSAVTPDQHNYCGLGVLTNGMKGNSFKTVEEGVEAQIQHLFAYASKDPVPNGRTLIDPRFTYVTRGIAPKWIDLNKRWSSTDIYGQTILSVYRKLVSTL